MRGESPSSAPLPSPPPSGSRLRPRNHYFVKDDLVWVRPAKLPYWPAEVIDADERFNRVRARLLMPPNRTLLDANLRQEETMWAKATKRHAAEQRTKRPKCEPHPTEASGSHHDRQGDDEDEDDAVRLSTPEADVVTASGGAVHFFDKLETAEEFEQHVEERLQRSRHNVSAYEAAFVKAVTHANELVRTVLSPERLKPYSVCGIGVVHSLMRRHISAPRQPHTKDFAPQTAVIRLRRGLENAVRDLSGFEFIWVLFQFSYAAAFATGAGQAYIHQRRQEEQARASPPRGDGLASSSSLSATAEAATAAAAAGERGCTAPAPPPHSWGNRQGIVHSEGFKTMLVPPRDEVLRGVLATRSPHRPNFIGLSCVRLLRVHGLDVHIADHDLLHGTPVLDIKPYLPFCDAHPTARAGWVEELDSSGKGKGDHKASRQTRPVDRVFGSAEDEGHDGE